MGSIYTYDISLAIVLARERVVGPWYWLSVPAADARAARNPRREREDEVEDGGGWGEEEAGEQEEGEPRSSSSTESPATRRRIRRRQPGTN